jgi:hypothetical protein
VKNGFELQNAIESRPQIKGMMEQETMKPGKDKRFSWFPGFMLHF